jgi:hypothetical protein
LRLSSDPMYLRMETFNFGEWIVDTF